MKNQTFGLLIFIFLMLGCATQGVVLKEVPFAAADIRKSFGLVLGEPRVTSENGREFLSQYFDKNEKPIAADSKERYWAEVEVLGDRRPFDVRTIVHHEKKFADGFEELEEDERLAAKISDKINKQLHQGRDNRNIIDDFKPF